MEETAMILLIAALAAFAIPVFHAVRSGDGMAIVGVLVLTVVAGITAGTGKTVIHEILGALIWIGAYIVAALADYCGPYSKASKAAIQTAENAARMTDHLNAMRGPQLDGPPEKRPMSSFFKTL